jgi:histidine triad (HIT) family protein
MYNHAPESYKCPLCAIANDEIEKGPLFSPDDLIFVDKEVLALISAYQWPNNPGNVVVFPTSHYENIYVLPVSAAARIHDLARGVALAMKAVWNCDGVSTRQHNEPAGNQDTWHYHMHVTPRYERDNLYATYATAKSVMPSRQRARYANDLRSEMKDWKPTAA